MKSPLINNLSKIKGLNNYNIFDNYLIDSSKTNLAFNIIN